MDVDDRVVLSTPEGVDVELVLAGLGSRFSAALLDWLVRTPVLLAIPLVAMWSELDGFATAIAAIASFLLVFGYDVAFEVLGGGRTLGKRWSGIRVVDRNGGPVSFVTSVVRNLLRVIDLLPGFYLVGSIALFVSRKNQRLGDLAAGTLVIRDRRSALPAAWAPEAPIALADAYDVALVTPEEIATVRRFLERRSELLPDARRRLAADLAARLRPKVAGFDGVRGDEPFLEALTAARSW